MVEGGRVPLRPGVAGLIGRAALSGVRIAIATTTSRANVEALVRAAWGRPAGEVFEVIAAGDEVDAKKPAPDVYLLALERLAMRPGAAIALEDSRNGLASAKAAGLRVAVTPSVYTAGEDFSDADWLLPSLLPNGLPRDLRFA